MATKKYVQSLTQYLAGSGVIIGATSIILTSLTDIYGNAISSITAFGDKGYITLEPDTTNEEAATFTTVTANANGTVTLGGVSTALAQSPYTETSGLVRAHAGGTKLVITDNVAFWNTFANKNNDEVVTGNWSLTFVPVSPNDIATKSYVDSVAVAGAPNASTSTKGIVQEATQAQVDAKTQTGSTAAKLFQNLSTARSTLLSDYVVDTGAADAYVITPVPAITAYTTGQIFSFKSTNTNTTTSTLNVSGLGVKTIKKNGAANLVLGDILTGALVVVEYDGTNFQMISPLGYVITPSGSIQMYAGSTAPTGYLLCDGSAVSRTTYAALFAILSTTYGAGDASTTFNVPDMRGRIAVGVGTGTGGAASGTGLPTGGSALTAVARGTWKGEETHTLVTTEMPSHTHTISPFTTSAGGPNSMAADTTANNSTPVTLLTTGSAGSDGAHNNIQPVMGLNFIIKT